MKTKFITWLIILLVLANAATLSIFWIGRAQHRHPEPMQRGRQGGGPKDFIIKELAFNTDQQKKYSALVDEHRQKADEYLQNIRKAKDALFALLQNPSVTEDAKNTAVTAISKENEKLDLLTFEHFQKVRMIGNEIQKKKFDSIIVQALDMMAGPKGPVDGPPQGNNNNPEMKGKRPMPPAGTHIMHPDGSQPPEGGPDGYGPPPERDGRRPTGPPPEGGPGRDGPPPPGKDGMPPPPPPR